MKHCKTCDTTKPPEAFYRDSKSKDGLTSDCKDCRKKRTRARIKFQQENDPGFAEEERERARNKYHRLYVGKTQNPRSRKRAEKRYFERYPEKKRAHTAVRALRKKYPKLIPYGFEFHHWSYEDHLFWSGFILSRNEHRQIHRYIEYDQESRRYRMKDLPEAGPMNFDEHLQFLKRTLGRTVSFVNYRPEEDPR